MFFVEKETDMKQIYSESGGGPGLAGRVDSELDFRQAEQQVSRPWREV